MAEKEWYEGVIDKINRLHEQADEGAFVEFHNLSDRGKNIGNKDMQIIGLLNAAAIACKMGDYDLCFAVIDSANKVDEEISTIICWNSPVCTKCCRCYQKQALLINRIGSPKGEQWI
ncbi:MAG: hypothetical protein FWD40_06980 [Treponema sp.]|nr:hypothetical protein [Treponema sp.]